MPDLAESRDDELIGLALADYTRTAACELPSAAESGVVRLRNEMKYVVLRKGLQVLAVYRVDPGELVRQGN